MYENYTKAEYLSLYEKPLDELIEISNKITKENFNNTVEACSIISAKTGACSENCKYCAQSKHNHAEIECHPLMEVEEVKKAALSAKENGASRFCIVTSGRAPQGKDFEKILEMIKEVASIDGIHCCASLGLLSEDQISQIKEAGVERYNHNINTSENYHKNICTTHNFEDRVKTVKCIQKHGMEACCGVIIGMGESREDRIDMALSLKEINPKTVPINFLNPIKGTPLEDYEDKIDEEEILKTICIFRIILPKALLRYAGGRTTRLSKLNQKLGLIAGINSVLVGNYLTTCGSKSEEDKKMLSELELEMV
jgi:biotin synthase